MFNILILANCAICADCKDGEISKQLAESQAIPCKIGEVCGFKLHLKSEKREANCYPKAAFDTADVDDPSVSFDFFNR